MQINQVTKHDAVSQIRHTNKERQAQMAAVPANGVREPNMKHCSQGRSHARVTAIDADALRQVDKGGRVMPPTAVAADPQRRAARRVGEWGPGEDVERPAGANAELLLRSSHTATG